jgi:hypothetical protein
MMEVEIHIVNAICIIRSWALGSDMTIYDTQDFNHAQKVFFGSGFIIQG